MFINPRIAIEKGWIKGEINDKHIQPNAIDFAVEELYKVDTNDDFIITENGKQMRRTVAMVEEELIHSKFGPETGWWLAHQGLYDASSSFYVDLPEGVAAMLVVRSTLSRNGLTISSGLYDSGFQGAVACSIHNRLGSAFIGKGTRIGQIIFVASDSAGMYAGGYNHEQGTHWTTKHE